MYKNGTYTLTYRDIYGPAWHCHLVVKGFTVTGLGYTARGAMFDANRAMAKKFKFKKKMNEHKDVVQDIMADTVIKEFMDMLEVKVDGIVDDSQKGT